MFLVVFFGGLIYSHNFTEMIEHPDVLAENWKITYLANG